MLQLMTREKHVTSHRRHRNTYLLLLCIYINNKTYNTQTHTHAYILYIYTVNIRRSKLPHTLNRVQNQTHYII